MDITTALSSISSGLGLAKRALNARDNLKAQEHLTELRFRLSEVAMSALAISKQCAALEHQVRAVEDELREAKRLLHEKEGYTLAEIAPRRYAYARKPVQDGEQIAPPYFCQPCYDESCKVVLRLQAVSYDHIWYCCEAQRHQFPGQFGYEPHAAGQVDLNTPF